MSENLVWLLYVLSAAFAFAAVYRWRWRVTLAMLTPAAATTALWAMAVWLGSEEDEPAWFTVDLTLNASFALIFAAAGAALGFWLRERRSA